MALTKTVTKFFPTTAFEGGQNVGIHLKLEDDSETVIDQDFTEVFTKGSGIKEELKSKIRVKAQKSIDSYKANKAVFDSAAYESARAEIDNALEL